MTKAAKDRDRSLAMAKNELPLPEPDQEPEANGDTTMADADAGEEEEAPLVGSKIVVMHLGSQNLRIGFASDALPKTVPMVIARKAKENEAEENGGEPKPKRLKLDDGQLLEPEKMFGPDVSDHLRVRFFLSALLSLLTFHIPSSSHLSTRQCARS